MKNKYFSILFFFFLSIAGAFAQNVIVEIDGDDLFYSEPGCNDCLGDPDPRWRSRVFTSNGFYDWNYQENDQNCGWRGVTNFSWVPPQIVSATSSISMSFDGFEFDGFLCGADDNKCNGYANIGSVVINSKPPCQWNYDTYQRICGSGTYQVKWSYFWYYQTVDPGTIGVNDTICVGGDPDTIQNVLAGSLYADYQWQFSDDSGTTWNNTSPADTNLFYDPPAGLTITRWYRRVASSCGNSGTIDSVSNVVIISMAPNPIVTITPNPQSICSGDSSSVLLASSLPGTTFTWTVSQTNSLGATAGSGNLINQQLTSTSSVPDTAYYIITPTTGLCTNPIDTAIVIVNSIPTATATPTSQTFCSGDSTSITLTNSASSGYFTWTVFQSNVTGGSIGTDSSLLVQTLYNTSGNAGTAIYNVTPVSNGCAGTPIPVTITVNSQDDASFTYPSATYCVSGSPQTPTITGVPGGTFSSTPLGLSINPNTGVINLAGSTPNTYTLTYTTNGICQNSSSITMTILNANPSSDFSYPSPSYCQTTTNPLPVFPVGASAGIFSSIPVGLVFTHVNTGEIDVANSAPGTYLVYNTIPPSGSCPLSIDSTIVVINQADDASFTYPSATYCVSASPQTPTITGLAGGTFSSSPAGLSINPTTGVIDPSLSLVGSYNLTYTTNGPCANSSSIVMTIINSNPSANFSYLGSPFCQGGSNPSPLFVPGSSAGLFSATPFGLTFAHVNTGEIDLANSTPGTYTVTNTIPANGSCGAAIATTTVTIGNSDDASFVYSSATYCTGGANPTPVITGVPGGFFSATPVGLALNPTTGTINLATSTVGTYTLTYTTNSACPGTSSITMNIIVGNPAATFVYPSVAYCQGGTNPFPVFASGSTAGIFSAVPVGLSFANLNTGEIDLTSSAPGTYTITNTIPQSGPCPAISASTTVIINPSGDASFAYSSATYCQSLGTTQTPIITGLSGGTFTATPNGLTINPSTGVINLGTSTPGVYNLTYTTGGSCPGSSSITMTILTANPSASFSYAGSPFCQNTLNPFPTFPSGSSAGIFTATPVGLVFNQVNTGEIDLANSTPGTYIVTNTIPPSGNCPGVSATSVVTINVPDDASFVYSSATYCASGANPVASITGLPGGSFLAVPPGLAINPSTGEINLANSTIGTYSIIYTTNGSCPASSSITMNIITANPNATFSYSNASFCQNETSGSLPIFPVGASAGTFTASPVGLAFVHVNTGEIDFQNSLPGTYVVTNIIPLSGTCAADTATTTVTITASDNAQFTYSSATYCTSGTNPAPTITGIPGGIFSSSPVGLSVNPTTGIINLFTSVVGTYTLTYTTNGPCPNSSSILMTIADTTPTASCAYNGGPYCENTGSVFPTIAPGTSIGTFSATPTGLVFINTNTGEIDLSASAPGTYTVTNFIPVSGSCDSASASTTFIIKPAPVITASPSPQTICVGGTTSITLSSTLGGTNTAWTVISNGVSGATAGIGPVIIQTLGLNGTLPGTAVYTVTSISGGCVGEPIDVLVNVNLLPTADTTNVTTTLANCGEATGDITGVTMLTGAAPFQYVWTNAQGNTVGTSANLTDVVPGAYTLTVTDANGCNIVAGTFTVNPTPPIVAQFTADTLTGQTPFVVDFTNTSIGASTYLWDFGTGDTSVAVSPTYTYIPLGQSIVCLTAISATGCTDTLCDTVDVFLNSVFTIPNIFTPNDDGINDIFSVNGVGLVEMNAEIFNRWGAKVYEWNTTNGGWNGRTTAGVAASAGTYYCIISAKGVDGKEYFEKAYFILVRSE